MHKVAGVLITGSRREETEDGSTESSQGSKTRKEARLVERRKEKEENQKCKAIERYERDRRFAKSRAGVEMELQAFQYFSLEI